MKKNFTRLVYVGIACFGIYLQAAEVLLAKEIEV